MKKVVISSLLLFVLVSLVIALGFFSMNVIKKTNELTLDSYAQSMDEKTEMFLEKTVDDQTKLAGSVFDEVKGLVMAAEEYVLYIHNNPREFEYVQQYLDTDYARNRNDPIPKTAPRGLIFSDRYNRLVSFKYMNIKAAPGITIERDVAGSFASPDPNIIMSVESFSPLVNFFRSSTLEHDYIKWIYFGTPEGLHFVFPGHGPYDPAFDNRDRVWYKDAVDKGEFGWGQPYIDASGTGVMIAASKPVYQNGKLLGVVGVDITIDTINEQIINMGVSKSGYSYLIDNEGKVIARPDIGETNIRWDESFAYENLLNTSNEELNILTNRMVDGETGTGEIILDTTYGPKKKYVAYAPIDDLNWGLAAVLPADEINTDVERIEKQMIEALKSTREKLWFAFGLFALISVIAGFVLGCKLK